MNILSEVSIYNGTRVILSTADNALYHLLKRDDTLHDYKGFEANYFNNQLAKKDTRFPKMTFMSGWMNDGSNSGFQTTYDEETATLVVA